MQAAVLVKAAQIPRMQDTVINNETAIDSMGFVLIICKLEALFDVRIPERQWKKLQTLGDVVDAIYKRLA